MKSNTLPYLFIDFDSTITRVEALDVLAEMLYGHVDEEKKRIQDIAEITRQAMEGLLPFDQALQKRVELLQLNASAIHSLVQILQNKISQSFLENRTWIKQHANRIFILSGGFKEFIIPIASEFDIAPEHVIANEFEYNHDGVVIGFNSNLLLSRASGKVLWMKEQQFDMPCDVLGDGFTDYEIRQAGLCRNFYLFTENVRRESLVGLADREISHLNQLIEIWK
ncbi:MAG TPA: HAD-IB family phosphatase [Chitinophagaceae bacterium]|nr:HAD-IB family phosphatase [Chitinophagaceae bacterium]